MEQKKEELEEKKKSDQELLMAEEEKEEETSLLEEEKKAIASVWDTQEPKEDVADENGLEQVKKKKKAGFKTGILTGFLSCIALLFIAAAVFVFIGRLRILNSGSSNNLSTESTQQAVLSSTSSTKINELVKAIDLYYYKDVNNSDLTTGLYKGLMKGLNDPYSAYYTPEEYKNLMAQTNGNFYGIGAGLSQDAKTMQVSITKIYDGSPAQEAGLKVGDIIVNVGDIDATSMDVTDLVQHIRGEEGSTVHLKVYRQGADGYLQFDIKRAKVNYETVTGQMLDNGIGYITISEFGEDTANQFETTVKTLQGQGMKGMIVDLRNNGGGLVTAVTKILDDILPEGTIVYTKDKYGNRQDFKSSGNTSMKYPMAVLVNGYSASASEIFAGAIRDYKYGTLIGTKTYGKGVVQNIFPLKDGAAIKLTIAKYYTPNGENIQGTGIKPDITLDYSYTGASDQAFDYTKDNQIEKAIDVLNGEISK